MNTAVLTFIGLSICATRVLSQDVAPDSLPSAKSACVIPVAPSDSSNEIVYLRLASVGDPWNTPGKPLTKERRAQLALLLQEIRGFIEIPRPLSLGIDELTRFVDAPSDRVEGRAVPDIESSITFNLHSHGQISGTIVQLPAPLPQLDRFHCSAGKSRHRWYSEWTLRRARC